MSTTIEKNDVDISKLFNYGDKFTLVDRNGDAITDVYIRLVGDSELNRARVYALRCSGELRDELKDKNSEKHKAFIIDNFDDLSNNDLIELISAFSYQKLAKEAMDSTEIPIPKIPTSDAPLEEHESYQKEVDDYPLKRINAIKEKMDKLISLFKEELNKREREYLIKEYTNVYIANLCEQEMLTRFREMCAYFGCYKDKNYKNKMFSSFDVFQNLLPDVKKQIIENYSSVELSTDELKK